MQLSKSKQNRGYRVFRYIILILAAILALFPVYWMVKTSFTPNDELYVARPGLLPSKFTTKHYVDLFSTTDFATNMWNSFIIAILTTIVSLVISILASFSLTRLKYKGREVFKNSFLLAYLLPTAVLFIPMYVLVTKMGLYNNKWGLLVIYPTIVVPYCIYMMISYFKSIPFALEEAAMIDGCNRLKTLFLIDIPVTLPGISVVATFAFTMAWNEFLYAMVMTTSPLEQTITVALSSFKFSDSAIWGMIMAASATASAPVIILYVVAQSLLVSGRIAGSVK